MFAAPLGYLVAEVARDLGASIDALRDGEVAGPLGRTLVLAVSVTLSATVAGTGLAWLTTRTDVPLRRVWQILAPLPLVIPSFVGASALLAALAEGGLLDLLVGFDQRPDLYGFRGAWLVLTLFTYPYVYLPVAARFAALPPSLEESARLLGRRGPNVFRTVVLPQAAPAIGAGALLVFLYTISDFGAVQLLRYDTLTRVIYANRLVDRTTSQVFALLLGLLAITVVVAERAATRRRARVELTRARRPLAIQLGRWRWPSFLAAGGLLSAALLVPLSVLAWWAIRGATNRGVARLNVDGQEVGELVVNTMAVSVVAAVAAVVLVLPVAYLSARHRSSAGGVANALVVAGFALPGLVIALSITYWVLQAPGGAGLYQTFPVLIVAYVIHFGAQAMRAGQIAVAAVPHRLEDAARMLGAARVRRFRTLEVPLMLPGLAAGAGLVLLSTMKELPATLLLAPIGFRTLATRVWSSAEEGFLAEAGLLGLVLVAVSGVLTWVLVIRRSDVLD